MPRRRKTPTAVCWSPEVLAENAKLQGYWWRCETHGLTQDPILLGGHTYCPHEECSGYARLVHTDLPKRTHQEWNALASKWDKARRQARQGSSRA